MSIRVVYINLLVPPDTSRGIMPSFRPPIGLILPNVPLLKWPFICGGGKNGAQQ